MGANTMSSTPPTTEGSAFDRDESPSTTGGPAAATEIHPRDSDPPSEPRCQECGGELHTEGDETICGDCGLVVDEQRIDHGPEWRSSDAPHTEPNRAAMGVDRTRHDNGIGTSGYDPSPTKDSSLAAKRKQMLESSTASKKEREQIKALRDIKQAGSALDLPEFAIDQACVLFKKFHNAGDHIGYSLGNMAAAALYAAGRVAELGVTHKAVLQQFGWTDESDEAQNALSPSRLFEQVHRLSELVEIELPITTPAVYVPRVAGELGADSETVTIARQIAERVEGEPFATSGASPTCIAAAIVYEAFIVSSVDDKESQKAIAEAADVSRPAMRRHWKTITENDLGGDPRLEPATP